MDKGNSNKKLFDPLQERMIKETLEKGYRVEIIPNKHGFRIVKIERHELKIEKDSL